jgi:hypothetical protein
VLVKLPQSKALLIIISDESGVLLATGRSLDLLPVGGNRRGGTGYKDSILPVALDMAHVAKIGFRRRAVRHGRRDRRFRRRLIHWRRRWIVRRRRDRLSPRQCLEAVVDPVFRVEAAEIVGGSRFQVLLFGRAGNESGLVLIPRQEDSVEVVRRKPGGKCADTYFDRVLTEPSG